MSEIERPFEAHINEEPLRGLPAAVQSLGKVGEPVEIAAFEYIHSIEDRTDISTPRWFTTQLIDQRSYRTGASRQELRENAFDTMMNHARGLYKDYPDNADEILRRVRMWHEVLQPDFKLGDVLNSFTSDD